MLTIFHMFVQIPTRSKSYMRTFNYLYNLSVQGDATSL